MKDFLNSENFVTHCGKIVFDKSILNLSFDELKKNYKDKLDIYLERWGELAFIEGLSGEVRERTAFAMEQFAIYLTNEASENDYINEFEVIGFPMIRRIIAADTNNGFKGLKDPDLFKIDKFIKYCREIADTEVEEKLINSLKRHYKEEIDFEAEACAMLCEIIIDKFNGDEESFDKLIEKYITKIVNKE